MKEDKKKGANVPNLRFPGFEGEWEEKELGVVSEISSGGTPSRANPSYWDGNIPWVSTGLIDFNTIYQTEEKITEEGLQGSSAKLLPNGSLLMAMYGQGKTRGKVAILGIDAATNQACASIRPYPDVLTSKFLFYNLSKRYDEIRDLSNQGSQENLNGAIIKGIKLAYPLLSEQKRVTEFLSLIDERISTQSKIITQLESLMCGLRKKIFKQQIRFKDKGGNEFPMWKVKKLQNVCDIVGGGTPETIKNEYWDGNIQWFTPTEIKANFVSRSERTISQLGLKNSSAKILPKGTILLTTRATIGEVAIALEECTTNQGFQSLVVKKGINNTFLFHWIKENKYELMKRANGSTFPEVSKSEIERIQISIPSLMEQSFIADFFCSVNEKIETETKILKEYEVLKQYLLKNMFV